MLSDADDKPTGRRLPDKWQCVSQVYTACGNDRSTLRLTASWSGTCRRKQEPIAALSSATGKHCEDVAKNVWQNMSIGSLNNIMR